jgi:hypothetical protein
MFSKIVKYLEKLIFVTESWFKNRTVVQRCNFIFIPTFLIMFWRLWSFEEMNIFVKIFSALYLPILATVGSYLIFSLGIIIVSGNESKHFETAHICSCCVAFVFSIYVLGGFWFAEDRAERRDELIDRAFEYLKEHGERVNKDNLKNALRAIEEQDSYDNEREVEY